MAIHWLTPAALAGLVLLAIPIAIHLVARTPVKRVVVPSLRLVDRQVPRLRRRRHPRDLALLALRLGALGAAAVASAGPLLVTGAQQRTSTTSPESGANRSLTAFTALERRRMARTGVSAPTSGSYDEDDVAQLIGREARDADRCARTLLADPLVLLGVGQVVGYGCARASS